MYYIKWHESLYDYINQFEIKEPYFLGFEGPTSWGYLKEAKSFFTLESAKSYLQETADFLLYDVEYIFIHPLNFKNLA